MPEPVVDSCYFCEIGKEGLMVPIRDQTILVCMKCVLECIWSHPKMLHHRKVA